MNAAKAVTVFLVVLLKFAAAQNDVSGKKCSVPAICTTPTSKYISTEWVQLSGPQTVCEASPGMKGDNISTGEIGPAGPKGEIGVSGKIGPVGATGEKGDKGNIGPVGPSGEIGDKGEIGTSGPGGEKGSIGEIGPVGPKGEKGSKGEIGPGGPKGDKGAKGEVGPPGLNNDSRSMNDSGMEIIKNALCPVQYDSKCFIPVIWATYAERPDHTEAVAACKHRGGEPANIYSQTHMEKIMNYTREYRWINGTDVMVFRLGMIYDPQVNNLKLRDGTTAPDGLKWMVDKPLNKTTLTNVLLRINIDPASEVQYLQNHPPGWKRNIICEIE